MNKGRLIITCLLIVGCLIGVTPSAKAQGDANVSPDANTIISQLPKELQNQYAKVWNKVFLAAYDSYTPSAPPWKFCFSDSYQGNPWRVAVRTEFERLVKLYQDSKLVSEYIFRNANNDVDLQNAHIAEFIKAGCSIIFSIPSSTNGHDKAIQAAFNAGIPFIAGEGAVDSPYAITVTSNFYTAGYDLGMGIAKSLNGRGNVLLVEGLKGHNIVLQQRQGVDAAFAQYPEIKIIGTVNGDWTPDVTRTALRDVLGLIREPIDAVWTTGSEARIIAEVFEERGLPLPLITASISGDALGYWKDHAETFKFYGYANLPGRLAQAMFKVGVRMLQGQKPKLNILMMPVPEVTQTSLADWYKPCMNSEAGAIFPIAPTDPVPDELLTTYFKSGAPIPRYDYAKTPNPCETVASAK